MFNADIGIVDIAYKLGSNFLSNQKLHEIHPTWDMNQLHQRTGVKNRCIAGPNETALTLARDAASNLLKKLNFNSADIDAIIFCTQTPNHILPPNSSLLHRELGFSNNVMAFDINHACSGFVYSIGIASGLICADIAKNVLVVTADTYSRLIHPLDRSTISLFGDAAACTLVSLVQPKLKILDMNYGTSGSHAEKFFIKNGPMQRVNGHQKEGVIDSMGRVSSPNHIHMDGLGVLSFFNAVIPAVVNSLLDRNNKTISDIDHYVFHQASAISLSGIAKALKIPNNKMIVDMADTGNLVSASIPVVLERLITSGSYSSGDLVVLCGFGVGLSWGAILLEIQ